MSASTFAATHPRTDIGAVTTRLTVTVPQGISGGDLVRVAAPDGSYHSIMVPGGLMSGQQFSVELLATSNHSAEVQKLRLELDAERALRRETQQEALRNRSVRFLASLQRHGSTGMRLCVSMHRWAHTPHVLHLMACGAFVRLPWCSAGARGTADQTGRRSCILPRHAEAAAPHARAAATARVHHRRNDVSSASVRFIGGVVSVARIA